MEANNETAKKRIPIEFVLGAYYACRDLFFFENGIEVSRYKYPGQARKAYNGYMEKLFFCDPSTRNEIESVFHKIIRDEGVHEQIYDALDRNGYFAVSRLNSTKKECDETLYRCLYLWRKWRKGWRDSRNERA